MFCPECGENLSEFEDIDNEDSTIFCPGCDSELYLYNCLDENDEDGDVLWFADIK